MWGWISYDPELNLIYHGTGNPGPWNPSSARATTNGRRGSLRATPIRARRAGSTNSLRTTCTTRMASTKTSCSICNGRGSRARFWSGPERNGYLYVIDRANGEVLSAEPYAYINSTSGSGSEDRAVAAQPEKDAEADTTVRDICPTAPGAKDWNPSAFSPRPAFSTSPTTICAWTWQGLEANYIAGTPYVGAEVKMKPGPGGNRGEFSAWDPWRTQEGLVDQGEFSGLERRGGDRRRRGLLRHHGGMVQSGRCPRPASCCGSSRPAPESSASLTTYRAGRPAVRRDSVRRWRLVWRDRFRRPRSPRRHGRAGFRECHGGSQARQQPKEDRCMFSGCRSAVVLCLYAGTLEHDGDRTRAKGSARIPTTCHFQTNDAKDLKTGSSS